MRPFAVGQTVPDMLPDTLSHLLKFVGREARPRCGVVGERGIAHDLDLDFRAGLRPLLNDDVSAFLPLLLEFFAVWWTVRTSLP